MKNKTFNTPEGKREFIDSIFERIKNNSKLNDYQEIDNYLMKLFYKLNL